MLEEKITEKTDFLTYLNLITRLEEIGAKITSKIEGLDQFYLDFVYLEQIYTLHREHFLGIFLLAKKEMNPELLKKLKI